eukprot:2667775-Rhodomonas_salina.4
MVPSGLRMSATSRTCCPTGRPRTCQEPENAGVKGLRRWCWKRADGGEMTGGRVKYGNGAALRSEDRA